MPHFWLWDMDKGKQYVMLQSVQNASVVEPNCCILKNALK